MSGSVDRVIGLSDCARQVNTVIATTFDDCVKGDKVVSAVIVEKSDNHGDSTLNNIGDSAVIALIIVS